MRLYLILFFFAQFSSATELTVSEGDRELVRAKIKWSFADVDADATALVARAVIPLAAGEKPVKVTGDGVFWKPTWVKPGKMMIGLGALNSKIEVTMADGAKREWTARLVFKDSPIVEEGCKAVGLKVKPVKERKRPWFLGVRCVKKAKRVILQMSVPQEVEWDTTSIFEVNGKGERWKVFELSSANLVGEKNTVGEFTFRSGNETFTYALVQAQSSGKEAVEVKPPEKAFLKLRLGGGLAQLNSQTPALSGSGIGPLFAADLYTLPLFANVRSIAEMKFVAPLTGHQYYEYSIGMGPAFAFGPEGFLLVAGEYLGLGQDQDVGNKTISLRHNQLGLALLGRFGGPDSFWGLTARYSGLGGDSTHLAFGGDYESRIKGKNTFWGVSLRYQMQSAKGATGDSTFGQMILAGTYRL